MLFLHVLYTCHIISLLHVSEMENYQHFQVLIQGRERV